MRIICLLLLCLISTQTYAHVTKTSAVFLDIRDDAIALELHLPLDQLRLALPAEYAAQPWVSLLPPQHFLTDYITQHIKAQGENQTYRVVIKRMQHQLDHLIVYAELLPSTGQVASFKLDYRVILHRVVSHKIFVTLRSDFKNAIFSHQPQTLGVLRYQHHTLPIDLNQRSLWRGFYHVFNVGMQHIAHGFDHLLFLFALLLPAPLLAQPLANGKLRWLERRSLQHSVWFITKVVSAFTLGHSITLAFGIWEVVSLPSQWVESLVAFSILVSALHAIRPFMTGYEVSVAAGFGLIHGLAFASELHELGYDTLTLLTSVLAFNLGIEAMQFIIVLLVMPGLLLLSRQLNVYQWVRVSCASLASVAALGWLFERTLQVEHLGSFALKQILN